MDIKVEALLGLMVLAGFVGTVENVLLKPVLLFRWPWLENNSKAWDVAVNGSTLALSLVFSFLALWALNQFSRLDIAQAFLTSISASLIAIGGYGAQGNLRRLVQDKGA